MKPLRALILAGSPSSFPDQTRLEELRSCGWAVATETLDGARSGRLAPLLEAGAPHLVHAIDPEPRLLAEIRRRYGGPAVVQFDRRPSAVERLAVRALRFDQIAGGAHAGARGLPEAYLLVLNRAFAPPSIRPARMRDAVPA
jgi:hypothetical protein